MSNFELKAGMYVELKNGLSGILVPWHGKLSVLGPLHKGAKEISALCGPRLYEDDKADYSIVRVFSDSFSNRRGLGGCFSTAGRELLYEYTEAKELTVSEIEALLGYKVKIVEG